MTLSRSLHTQMLSADVKVPTNVNTNIEKFLQDPTAPAYTGDDPIIRARLGSSSSTTLTA